MLRRVMLAFLGCATVALSASAAWAGDSGAGPTPRFQLSVGYWLGQGRWRFVGPTDASAQNGMWSLDLRYHLARNLSLSAEYAWGNWGSITFNGSPASPSVGGDVGLWSLSARATFGPERLPLTLLFGWQGYRARAWDLSVPITDTADASGIRLGMEGAVRLNPVWSVRAALTVAPSLSVTETVSNSGTSVTTYSGTLWDGRLALAYQASPSVSLELGWRGQRLELRRPSDTVEHTLEGVYLLVRGTIR